MRLAGTWSRYSNSAMPQLANAATYHGRSLRFFRCAYQANVMKTLERTSSTVVRRTTGMRGIGWWTTGAGAAISLAAHGDRGGTWPGSEPRNRRGRRLVGHSVGESA